MSMVGIRGATTAVANTGEAILNATRELLNALIEANGLTEADVASVYFTLTPDLDAAFPAAAARQLGWDSVALLDAQAPRVVGDLPHCIRVLIHCNCRSPARVQHIYLREARQLRPSRAWPA